MNPVFTEQWLAAEEDVAGLMLHVESGDGERAREFVNALAADGGVTRLAWALLRCADLLYRQERLNERLIGVSE